MAYNLGGTISPTLLSDCLLASGEEDLTTRITIKKKSLTSLNALYALLSLGMNYFYTQSTQVSTEGQIQFDQR